MLCPGRIYHNLVVMETKYVGFDLDQFVCFAACCDVVNKRFSYEQYCLFVFVLSVIKKEYVLCHVLVLGNLHTNQSISQSIMQSINQSITNQSIN